MVAKKSLCIYSYQLPNNSKSQYIIDKMHKILEIANRKFDNKLANS